MNQPTFLNYLREHRCGYNKNCRMRISKCPIVLALEEYNKNKSDLDQIRWCPRCYGVYFHQKEIQVDKQSKTLDIYEGGLLLIEGTQPKTRGYEFVMACDCRSGDVRFKVQNRMRYTLTDENQDWCYLQWRQHRIETRLAESKGILRANPVLKALFLRVLSNPTAIVDRPKPPEPPEPIEEEPAITTFDQPEMDLEPQEDR